jgi:hypothetical protein
VPALTPMTFKTDHYPTIKPDHYPGARHDGRRYPGRTQNTSVIRRDIEKVKIT